MANEKTAENNSQNTSTDSADFGISEQNNSNFKNFMISEVKEYVNNIIRGNESSCTTLNGDASVALRDTGDVSISSGLLAHINMNNQYGSIEETCLTKSIMAPTCDIQSDDIYINNHKFNNKIYELADWKKVLVKTVVVSPTSTSSSASSSSQGTAKSSTTSAASTTSTTTDKNQSSIAKDKKDAAAETTNSDSTKKDTGSSAQTTTPAAKSKSLLSSLTTDKNIGTSNNTTTNSSNNNTTANSGTNTSNNTSAEKDKTEKTQTTAADKKDTTTGKSTSTSSNSTSSNNNAQVYQTVNTYGTVGGITMLGTVLTRSWDLDLGRYVLIRRLINIPLFSPNVGN